MADAAPSTYYTGWGANTIAATVGLKDASLGSRYTPSVNPAVATEAAGYLPTAVYNAIASLPYGGITSTGITPLQQRILNILGTDSGYLASPALAASAVQPGAYFSMASDSAFQNPKIGQGYYNVAKSVADAQSIANSYALQQLQAEQKAKDAYYTAAGNYNPYSGSPIGTAPLSSDLLWKDIQRQKAGQDTSRFLNSSYATAGSGWSGHLPIGI